MYKSTPRWRLSIVCVAVSSFTAAWDLTPAAGQCERQKLIASDGVLDDFFGAAVDVAGDLAVIGAWGRDEGAAFTGAAYVYLRIGDQWQGETKLVASDAEKDDVFGSSVRIDGELIVVGATLEGGDGAVYLYRFDGTQWIEEAKLKGPSGSSFFGASVAVFQDRVAVGSPGTDQRDGRVHVFSYDGVQWSLEASIASPRGPGNGGDFGSRVALSGPVLVVGERLDQARGMFAGTAWAWRYDGTSWGLDSELIAADNGARHFFGDSVAVDSNTAVVGAWGHSGAGTASGAAYVFQFDAGAWTETARLTASDADERDEFGRDVSIDGDIVVVSARRDEAAGADSGSGYLFRRAGRDWVEAAKLVPADGAASQGFASAVAVDGPVLVLGASGDNGLRGAAYWFDAGAAVHSYGDGWPGTTGVPSLTSPTGAPLLGSVVEIDIGNSAGVDTIGLFVLGFADAEIPTAADGTLLLLPSLLVPLTLPASGSTLRATIPADKALDGTSVFLQVLESDPGATRGVSFTRGLRLDLGDC